MKKGLELPFSVLIALIVGIAVLVVLILLANYARIQGLESLSQILNIPQFLKQMFGE